MHRGFYELYNDGDELDAKGVPNLEGCIPLTQPINRPIFYNLSQAEDLDYLLPIMWGAASA